MTLKTLAAAIALLSLAAHADDVAQIAPEALAHGHPQKAPAFDRVVYPTGDFPADVQNVQAAVDSGGTVLLKATNYAGLPTAFNFGTPNLDETVVGYQVALQGDVVLLGEAVASARTTITGGYRPVLVGLTGWREDYSPLSGRVQIRAIDFERSGSAAIDIYKASAVDIADIRISNVAEVGSIATGINVFGGGAQRRITGTVVIRNNVFRYRTEASWSHAIVLDNLAADADIVRNRLETTQEFSGILVVRQVEGTVRIADNFIVPDAEIPGDGTAIYIYANDLFDDIRTSIPRYEVVGNRVVTDVFGIGLVGERGSIDGPVIRRNHITTGGLFGWEEGIYLGGNVSLARIAHNRIDGGGAYGIDIFAFQPGQLADSNTVVDNVLTQFDANTADVFLDTHTTNNRVIVNRSDTVVDLGSGNQVIRRPRH